jgi:hypothetical protein
MLVRLPLAFKRCNYLLNLDQAFRSDFQLNSKSIKPANPEKICNQLITCYVMSEIETQKIVWQTWYCAIGTVILKKVIKTKDLGPGMTGKTQ